MWVSKDAMVSLKSIPVRPAGFGKLGHVNGRCFSVSKISLVGGLFVARVHWTLKMVLEGLYRWKLWETDLVRRKTKSVTPIYVVKYVR